MAKKTVSDYEKIISRVLKRCRLPSQHVDKVYDYLLDLTETIHINGNFTTVILIDEAQYETKAKIKGVGVSKRNPTDPVDDHIGHNIALTRAIEDAAESYINRFNLRLKQAK